MKTAICYYSAHHGNTKLILDAIAETDTEVMLIDCTKKQELDLLPYERIGFASGIYYGSFAKQLVTFAQINLPTKRDVFFIYTCGNKSDRYTDRIREIAVQRDSRILGTYGCFGFDTFGPFKLVGGIKKEHPTEEEIDEAVRFYQGL